MSDAKLPADSVRMSLGKGGKIVADIEGAGSGAAASAILEWVGAAAPRAAQRAKVCTHVERDGKVRMSGMARFISGGVRGHGATVQVYDAAGRVAASGEAVKA